MSYSWGTLFCSGKPQTARVRPLCRGRFTGPSFDDGWSGNRWRRGRSSLVEDDKQTSDIISKGLREHGHVVDRADNGRDGPYLATGEKYDVIIVDRMLPAMDGCRCQGGAFAGAHAGLVPDHEMGGIDDRVNGFEAAATTTS